MERYQAIHSPETKGRVGRLKDGRIGRLGWKGQTASTEDFVLNACAVELGLEVPGHPQAVVPQAPKYRSPGLDLNAEECAALVAYVRSLPGPVERRASSVAESNQISAGKTAFADDRLRELPRAEARRRRGDLQRPAAPRHGQRDGR